MKSAIYALSLAAALAVGGSALAANATAPAGSANDTGMATLGVDISNAGNTPADVHSFVAGLSTDQQSGIKNGCQQIASNPANANPKVVSFCDNLNAQ